MVRYVSFFLHFMMISLGVLYLTLYIHSLIACLCSLIHGPWAKPSLTISKLACREIYVAMLDFSSFNITSLSAFSRRNHFLTLLKLVLFLLVLQLAENYKIQTIIHDSVTLRMHATFLFTMICMFSFYFDHRVYLTLLCNVFSTPDWREYIIYLCDKCSFMQ